MHLPVIRKQLDNGLTILMREMHHAPVASFWVWYRVGSRNELGGMTGASHWVEHMMFKGSPEFPPGSLDRLMSREGGRFNAFTWLDFTAYFETLPSDRIDLALRVEADRMTNTIMTEEAVNSERTVIISERHMYENEPSFLLREELVAAAFRVHSYHHDTIGEESDLQTMTREDLVRHYHQNYAPNNAIVVVAGDIQAEKMATRIDELFGPISPSDLDANHVRPEPPQRGERRVTVRGPGDTQYLSYAFRSPPATHPDFLPLVLLNAAYTGGSGLGLFGNSTTNKSSRLYRALVARELAVAVSGRAAPTIDPYLYTINAIAAPGRTAEEVETVLAQELDDLEHAPITEEELQKAIKRARVQFVMAGESVTGQGNMIGMAEVVAGDFSWYENTLDRLTKISLEDIQRVYKQYINRDNLTVGIYKPGGNGGQ